MAYEYKDPTEHGYTRIQLPENYKEYWKYLKNDWTVKLEVFYNENTGVIKIHRFSSLLARLLSLPFLPYLVFKYGWDDIKVDLYKTWNERKTGAFRSDTYYAYKIVDNRLKKIEKEPA